MEHPMFAPHGTLSPTQLLGPLGILVVCAVFWVWMFQDMRANELLTTDEKNTWLWVFVLLNVFGAAIYFANVYRSRH
jgi:hypothetical protein